MRTRISRRIRSAIMCSRSESWSSSRNRTSSSIGRRVSSQMLLPPMVTASVSGFSRAPLHERQATSRMYCSNRSRAVSDSASSWRRSMLVMTPSNTVVYERCRP